MTDRMSSQYDIHKDPHKNIALPDSLLSRFDLLFIVTDDVDEKRDRMIADHVLRIHRYLPPGIEEGTPVPDTLSQPLSIDGPATTLGAGEEGEASPFEKYDPLLHVGVVGAKSSTRRGKEVQKEVLSVAFVKKYIQYAKSKPAPVLTKGAADHIVRLYAELRNEGQEGNQKRVRLIFIFISLLVHAGRADRPHPLHRLPRSRLVRSRRSSVSRQRTQKRGCRRR